MFKKIFTLLMLVATAFCVSCNFAPKYEKPANDIVLNKHEKNSKNITSIDWHDYFKYPPLQQVIELALKNNYNLQIAYQNIEISRQTHNIARAALLPSVNASVSAAKQHVPADFAAFTPQNTYKGNLNLALYEFDFFGKLRNAKKAAFEGYLATVEAKNAIELALITDTAKAYIQLLTDKKILQNINNIVGYYQQMVRISYAANYNASATKLSLNQAKLILLTAQSLQNTYFKIVQQDKNILMQLLSDFEEKNIPRGNLEDITFNRSLISNLPSESLLNRPDILAAEHNLIAANANIGVARASFFPSITITGYYGYMTQENMDLFRKNNGGFWSIVPRVDIPIFQGGGLWANLKISKLQQQKLVTTYKKTVQNAFKESLDYLTAFKEEAKNFENAKDTLSIQSQSCNIIESKFQQGITSKTNLLNCKIAFTNAKTNFLAAKKINLEIMTDLYKALGVGTTAIKNDTLKPAK